jgi:precorrin-2 dehydrogenase/sirohydrochlorin ferrochelatase
LLAAGASRIRCVSPDFCDDLPYVVERISSEYDRRHIEGAKLVFAATSDRNVNDRVVRDARQLGVPVNRADTDDSEPGDFITPAKLEVGRVCVTVSAGSAALSAAIRDDLAGRLDRKWIGMAEAMIVLRPVIRSSSLSSVRRVQVFRDLTGDEALQSLDAGGIEALRGWLLGRYPELNHG